MEQFSLDTWLQDKRRKVVTRSGHNVRILCTDQRGNMPIVALVEFETLDGVQIFYSDGKNESHREYDLFFADEERLSEFEKELINIVFKYKYWSNNKDEVKQYIKTDSKKLLDLARKELQPEFDKELEKAYKTQDDVVYRNGYAQGKQDALKAALESLPKWKKGTPPSATTLYVIRKGYYMTIEEVDELFENLTKRRITMKKLVLLLLLIPLFGIIGILKCRKGERKDWNKGICLKCGKPLKQFDTDSQGGEGWCCNDCRYYTWVSYKRYVYKTRNQ